LGTPEAKVIGIDAAISKWTLLARIPEGRAGARCIPHFPLGNQDSESPGRAMQLDGISTQWHSARRSPGLGGVNKPTLALGFRAGNHMLRKSAQEILRKGVLLKRPPSFACPPRLERLLLSIAVDLRTSRAFGLLWECGVTFRSAAWERGDASTDSGTEWKMHTFPADKWGDGGSEIEGG
jgi:hypothetical protein